MKFLTVIQPYAEMLARGPDVKPVENRKWFTPYRGPIAVHAGLNRSWLEPEDIAKYPSMVFGAVVCVGRLVACLDLYEPWPERFDRLRTHDEVSGPYCLVIENMRRLLKPVYCRGAQGLWVPSDHRVIAEIEQQMKGAA
jgi:activating signal cointegrator 1